MKRTVKARDQPTGKNMVVNTENSLPKPKTMSLCLSSLPLNKTLPNDMYIWQPNEDVCCPVRGLPRRAVCEHLAQSFSCMFHIKLMSAHTFREPLNCLKIICISVFVYLLLRLSNCQFPALCRVFSPAQVAGSHTSASNKHFLEKKIKWVSTRGN